jgi:hypothetical protein
MIDCKYLIHPFQNDPGTSQSQRVMEQLLSGSAQIDGRTLADLLNFFSEIAPHINFYDTDLQISDWQPFFQQGLPFLLSSVCSNNADKVTAQFNHYNDLFNQNPSTAGIQLTLSYIYQECIKKINSWYVQVKDTSLGIVTTLEQSIKNKLQQPLKQFISIANAARKWYCVKPIDFTCLLKNDLWGLDLDDLNQSDEDFKRAGKSNRKRLMALQNAIVNLFAAFGEAIKTIATQAEQDLPLSFTLSDENWNQQNAPHLALLFCFIQIFQQRLDELNGFTGKHLDFFYKEVLQIIPQAAVPDQANIVFQLQNQVKTFLLKQNRLVKDGKDSNNADIEFSLDDDIVVNETVVTDIRTLFLNNETAHENTYVEGVYIAQNATKADGINIDFQAGQPANYPTLGAKFSKYIPPTETLPQAYPNARIGFILASNVLMLGKADRTIEFTLDCQLTEKCGATNKAVSAKKMISRKRKIGKNSAVPEDFPAFIPSKDLFKEVQEALNSTYVYLNEDLIQAGIKKGLRDSTVKTLRKYLVDPCKKSLCNQNTTYYIKETTFSLDSWSKQGFTQNETSVLNEILPLRRAFSFSFSGEKDWILPSIENILDITLTPSETGSHCILYLKVQLTASQDPVTSYNNVALKEDFGTTKPLVKIELDESLRIQLKEVMADSQKAALLSTGSDCCLDRNPDLDCRKISLYHFFRNLLVENGKIDVTVCGLKNFTVQNDDTVQDVNSAIYPFGTRPKVDANFYIGSEEILLKKWEQLHINMNWKGLPAVPSGIEMEPFEYYYDGYKNYYLREKSDSASEEDRFELVGRRIVEDHKFKIDVAILQDGIWNYWDRCRTTTGEYNCGPDKRYGKTDLKLDQKEEKHCRLFQGYRHSFCNRENFSNQYQISRKEDFNTTLDSPNEPFNFLGYKQYNKSSIHGFIRITLKCQDFQHEIYPFVLAEYLIALARERQRPLDARDILVRPKEPWTPVISDIAIDYKATADFSEISLIHLYPYLGTYEQVEIRLRPTLLALFCEEGTLFLGLQKLVPGSIINILFQLAEATSDSESNPQTVYWQYLANNQWINLREGFEIIDDKTDNLTRSGIIKFAIPDDISMVNTIMPNTSYWIKAAVPQNSRAASETIAIYTQAVSATFTNNASNDKFRLSQPLTAGSISSLSVADSKIKQVSQPGPTFGGQAQEEAGPAYYLRVSELLRHKGRAIQKFDYERLVLQQFPGLFKVKCINHSFALNAHNYINDFPVAPGYVLLAVIPNLNLMQAGNSFEPKVPVSMLEDIEMKMQAVTSPFVRFRAMNPRYEKINFCLKVQLMPDRDPTFFSEHLKEDISEFLAPWAIGKYDKLTFGECVNKSDVVNFIETLEYVDYIVRIEMFPETETGQVAHSEAEICPASPRSILIAGDIEVSIQPIECEAWSTTGACRNKNILLNKYCRENEKILIQ